MQIQKAIKAIVDFLDKIDLPKDKAELENYKNKLTRDDIAEWQKKLNKLQVLNDGFSNSLLAQNRSRKKPEATGEDWFIAQREKYLFKYIVSHDVGNNLSTKLFHLLELSYLLENELAKIDVSGKFGQHMVSIYGALQEAEAQNNNVTNCFNQLISETSETALTYGQVLALAVGRLFLHINANEFLVREKKTLEKVLDTDIEAVEFNKLGNIWKYTREYGGPTLSNLKRKFDDFVSQIEDHIKKRKLPESVFSKLLDDLRMCDGLFLLATLKIKQATRVAKNNPALKDDEIRVAESFLTKNYQEVVFQLGSKVVDAALEQNIENELKHKLVAPIVKKSPTEIASTALLGDTAAQALKKEATSGIKTPVKPNLHNTLFKPVTTTPKQNNILKTALTPNMTNILIFYEDGSERKYRIENAPKSTLADKVKQGEKSDYPPISVAMQSIAKAGDGQQNKKRKFTLFVTPENSDVPEQQDKKRMKQERMKQDGSVLNDSPEQKKNFIPNNL